MSGGIVVQDGSQGGESPGLHKRSAETRGNLGWSRRESLTAWGPQAPESLSKESLQAEHREGDSPRYQELQHEAGQAASTGRQCERFASIDFGEGAKSRKSLTDIDDCCWMVLSAGISVSFVAWVSFIFILVSIEGRDEPPQPLLSWDSGRLHCRRQLFSPSGCPFKTKCRAPQREN